MRKVIFMMTMLAIGACNESDVWETNYLIVDAPGFSGKYSIGGGYLRDRDVNIRTLDETDPTHHQVVYDLWSADGRLQTIAIFLFYPLPDGKYSPGTYTLNNSKNFRGSDIQNLKDDEIYVFVETDYWPESVEGTLTIEGEKTNPFIHICGTIEGSRFELKKN